MSDQLQPSTLRQIRYAVAGVSLLCLLCCGLTGFQCVRTVVNDPAWEKNRQRSQELDQIFAGFQRELDDAPVALEPTRKLRGSVYTVEDDTRKMVTETPRPNVAEVPQSLSRAPAFFFDIEGVIPDSSRARPIENADFLICPKWTTNRRVTISVYDRKRKCIIAQREFSATVKYVSMISRKTGTDSSYEMWVLPVEDIERWLRMML